MNCKLIFLVLLSALAACTEYREPTVNCFNFLPVAPGEIDCDFTPLAESSEGNEIIG